MEDLVMGSLLVHDPDSRRVDRLLVADLADQSHDREEGIPLFLGTLRAVVSCHRGRDPGEEHGDCLGFCPA
jgi:hypothetical protein